MYFLAVSTRDDGPNIKVLRSMKRAQRRGGSPQTLNVFLKNTADVSSRNFEVACLSVLLESLLTLYLGAEKPSSVIHTQ